jgi:hypothetical protein
MGIHAIKDGVKAFLAGHEVAGSSGNLHLEQRGNAQCDGQQ